MQHTCYYINFSLFLLNFSLCRTLSWIYCCFAHTHYIMYSVYIYIFFFLSALNRLLKAFVFRRLATENDPFCLPTAFHLKNLSRQKLGAVNIFAFRGTIKDEVFIVFSPPSCPCIIIILYVMFDSVTCSSSIGVVLLPKRRGCILWIHCM